MEISVTQDHIDHSSLFIFVHSCPVALAIREVVATCPKCILPQGTEGHHKIAVKPKGRHHVAIVGYYSVLLHGTQGYRLPPSVAQWIAAYDRRPEEAQPFSFTLHPDTFTHRLMELVQRNAGRITTIIKQGETTLRTKAAGVLGLNSAPQFPS